MNKQNKISVRESAVYPETPKRLQNANVNCTRNQHKNIEIMVYQGNNGSASNNYLCWYICSNNESNQIKIYYIFIKFYISL